MLLIFPAFFFFVFMLLLHMDEMCMHRKKERQNKLLLIRQNGYRALSLSSERRKKNLKRRENVQMVKLIKEFAVGIGIKQLSPHFWQHLTSNHLQTIF